MKNCLNLIGWCMLLPTLVWGQQANVNLDYNPQKNTENLIPFSAPLNSPDVLDDGTVTFRLKAPEAKNVQISGALHNQVDRRNNPNHTELTFKMFEEGGRHTMFVGFNSLDLFSSFGVLSAGDVDSEKSIGDTCSIIVFGQTFDVRININT